MSCAPPVEIYSSASSCSFDRKEPAVIGTLLLTSRGIGFLPLRRIRPVPVLSMPMLAVEALRATMEQAAEPHSEKHDTLPVSLVAELNPDAYFIDADQIAELVLS